MDRSRRNFLQSSALLGASVVATRGAASTPLESKQEKTQMAPGMKTDNAERTHSKSAHRMAPSGAECLPVVTTDVPQPNFTKSM